MASNPNYGVTSSGFIRQTEAEIVQEIIDCFPADLQYLQGDYDTNLLEGITKLRLKWQEMAECNFNAQNNFKLATGCLLDNAVAALGYRRIMGESDADLIARICDAEAGSTGGFESFLESKIREIEGVCRVKIFPPRDRVKTGNENCQVETVVQGGDAELIARTVWGCSTGLENVGNTEVNFVDDDGNCQVVNFSVADEVEYCVRIFFRSFRTDCGTCDGATFATIQQNIFDVLTSKERCDGINIGGTIRKGLFNMPGIEIDRLQFAPAIFDPDTGECACRDHEESDWIDGPFVLGCRDVISIPDIDCICLIALPGSE